MTEGTRAPELGSDSPFGEHEEAYALVVSGPSGVGKTSICKAVLDRDERVRPIVTTTTRQARDGEVDGRDYHFVSDPDFDSLLQSGDLLENAVVHGFQYGATRSAFSDALGNADVVLLEVDVQGAKTWREVLGSRCVSLFLLPPSLEELRDRLAGRQSEGEDSLKVRTANAREEMSHAASYDYVIVNHQLEQAIHDVQGVITSERNRPARQHALLSSLGVD